MLHGLRTLKLGNGALQTTGTRDLRFRGDIQTTSSSFVGKVRLVISDNYVTHKRTDISAQLF